MGAAQVRPGAGASASTGPSGGIGSGKGPAQKPHDTTFRREPVRATGLDPRAPIVGQFTADGPTATGEATIQKGGAVSEAVRQLAESVEQVSLPVEQRQQVLRFQSLLRGEALDPEARSSDDGSATPKTPSEVEAQE